MTHGGANQSLAPGDLTYTFPPNLDFCKQAVPAIDVSSGSSETAAREQEETGMPEKDSEDRADEAQHVQTPSSAEADAEADAWDCASDFVQ